MNAKSIYMILIFVGIISIQAITVSGQSGQDGRRAKRGWSSLATGAKTAAGIQDFELLKNSAVESESIQPRATSDKLKLVGTWVMNVAGSADAPGFNALQTYNEDGTMTETSDLLAQLLEGPAHGVWSGKKNDYSVTFELFAFDENHQSVGRIRVRVSIHIVNDDNLTAMAAVDFIEPDGTVIPDIGGGPFTGTRVKVLPVQ